MKEISEETKSLALKMIQAGNNYPFVHDKWDQVDSFHDHFRYVKPLPDDYEKFGKRVKRAFGWIFRPPAFAKSLGRFGYSGRIRQATYEFRPHREFPDSTVNRGSIICFWDEEAEYISAVAPSDVAMVLEDLMDALDILPADFQRKFTVKE